jgi:hypothetical protein
MTEYWFGYYKDEPRVLYRIAVEDGASGIGERYDYNKHEWVTDDSINWYIYTGEIGYEKTTEEAAQQFIKSKLA